LNLGQPGVKKSLAGWVVGLGKAVVVQRMGCAWPAVMVFAKAPAFPRLSTPPWL
jgi:hypothetical protein